MNSFDIHTALGRYTVAVWPNDNRITMQRVDTVESAGPHSTYSWDPMMEAVVRAAVRADRGRVELIAPGTLRVTGDFERILERIAVKSGGQVPEGAQEEPGAATNRAKAVAAARRILEKQPWCESLRHAVEAAEAICGRRGSLKAFEVALRATESSASGELEERAARILSVARAAPAHEAARRARRALLGIGGSLLPDSPDPVADLLAWWDELPEAPGVG